MWPETLQWVRDHTDRLRRNEELDAREQLIAGKCKQGDSSVHTYFNRYRMLIANVPDGMSELEKISFFQSGLSPTLQAHCKLNKHGQQFTNFTKLFNHAVCTEAIHRATARTDSLFQKTTKSHRGNRRNSWKQFPTLNVQVPDGEAGPEGGEGGDGARPGRTTQAPEKAAGGGNV